MKIRRATHEDALAIARVHVRSWQAAYRGLIDDEFLDALRPEDRAPIYKFGAAADGGIETIVSEVGREIVGFSAFGPCRDADAAGAGEIYALYIDPGHVGTGAGRELLLESRRRLAAAGFSDGVLWVLRGNEGAERFYAADGWRRDGAAREEDPYGPVVEVRRFRRRLGD
ncbi:MAG TPA: GNAT family N-acetyltransferase [Solirubrobacterales bacterium]